MFQILKEMAGIIHVNWIRKDYFEIEIDLENLLKAGKEELG